MNCKHLSKKLNGKLYCKLKKEELKDLDWAEADIPIVNEYI